MTREFDRVNAALAASVAGRTLAFLEDAVAAAWSRSATGAAARTIRSSVRGMPAPAVIRTVAAALLIAAAAQPLLMSAMPATVVPAMPRAAFALLALFAGVAAWQAEAMAKAWPDSALARLIRR